MLTEEKEKGERGGPFKKKFSPPNIKAVSLHIKPPRIFFSPPKKKKCSSWEYFPPPRCHTLKKGLQKNNPQRSPPPYIGPQKKNPFCSANKTKGLPNEKRKVFNSETPVRGQKTFPCGPNASKLGCFSRRFGKQVSGRPC